MSIKQTYKLDLGLFIAEQQSNGTFLYKAKENTKLVTNKTQPKEKDTPQYPILQELIDNMQKQGKEMTSNISLEIKKYLEGIEL